MSVLSRIPELRGDPRPAKVQRVIRDEEGNVVEVKAKRSEQEPTVVRLAVDKERSQQQVARLDALDIGLGPGVQISDVYISHILEALEKLAEMDERSLVKAATQTLERHKPFKAPAKRMLSGFRQVARAVRRNEVFVVIVAVDVENSSVLCSAIKELVELCRTHGTPRPVLRDCCARRGSVTPCEDPTRHTPSSSTSWTPIIIGPTREQMGRATASPFSKAQRTAELSHKYSKHQMPRADKLHMHQCSVVAVLDPDTNIPQWRTVMTEALPVVLSDKKPDETPPVDCCAETEVKVEVDETVRHNTSTASQAAGEVAETEATHNTQVTSHFE